MKYSVYKNRFPGRTLKFALLGGFALVLLLLLAWSLSNEPTHPRKPLPRRTAVSAPLHQQVQTSLPARLKIPQINVDAAIEYEGLTPNGEMATTTNPSTVAWYKLGQRPGDVGSAVISGHFGWKNNIPAAFDHLTKLQPGDRIFIEDETGMKVTFVVRAVQLYSRNDDAKSVFSSSDGKSHLNLITCEGTWNSATHNYSNRFVVFSDKQ